MFEYIHGKITELTPTYIVLDTSGVGYLIHISLHTYSQLQELKGEATVFVHQVVREDAHMLYGFADKNERSMFRLLITVSGIGTNTARMMLSSMSPTEVGQAIAQANVAALKGIKGIGAKTAERVIVDLKDKVAKIEATEGIVQQIDNTIRDEAFSALVMLGFAKPSIDKVLDRLLKQEPLQTVEALVKKALKML